MKRITAILFALLLALSLSACGEQEALQDGYYIAQMAQYSHGWREYITILVKGGSIVSVEYNAENASGFIKSWDNAYMQTMLHSNGTYPNEYTRNYPGCAGAGPERGFQHCAGERDSPLKLRQSSGETAEGLPAVFSGPCLLPLGLVQ